MPFFVQKLILDSGEKEQTQGNFQKSHPYIQANEKIKNLDNSVRN